MTPKEKAQELVSNMYGCEVKDLEHVSIQFNDGYCIAKDSAIIAVNEIIKALRKDLPEIGKGKGYYQQVKQEIEKLSI